MNNPAHDVFAPFAPATPPVAPTTDAETTNAPKGRRGRKPAAEKKPRTPKTPAAAPSAAPMLSSAVQKTVIMVDAVALLTAMQGLDEDATSILLQALGAFQALKPPQRSQVACALVKLFP